MLDSQEMEAQKDREITGYSVHLLTRAVILVLSYEYLIFTGKERRQKRDKNLHPGYTRFPITTMYLKNKPINIIL